jgi:DNA-binding MarR family transcriptional regulator
VATRAGIAESVFREVFACVEECYHAAFEEGLERLSQTVHEAAGPEGCWLDRLRAGLVAFLGFLDDQPTWGRLLILDRPFTDERSGLRCQLRVLGVLTSLLDNGTPRVAGERVLEPTLTSEFVVGGAIAVIRSQMLKREEVVLVGLAPSLMSFMVRPYLGQVAASTELEGRSSADGDVSGATLGRSGATLGVSPDAELARAAALPIRVTHRTTMVLSAIAQAPYSNNREIAEAAGLTDEGQTSKLLARLERQGVIENVGVGAARGEPNAWLLTAEGRRAVEILTDSFAAPARRRVSRRDRGAS